MSETHTVHLVPVDVEFEVEEGETILDAAFRQGISLPHGCKEGQCSACKCILLEGEVELKKYSTFALSEMERDTDHILLCRALADSDVDVELLNYDEELLSKSIAVKDFSGAIVDIKSADARHPPGGNHTRQSTQILGRPICRHHDQNLQGGDDYALVFHGKFAERNHGTQVHHQKIPRRKILQ